MSASAAPATGRPTTLTAPTPSVEPAPAAERAGSHPAVPAVTSALLLWFAYPPADRGYLAWFALVPFFLLIGRDDRPRRLYTGAWLGGLVFWLLAVEWVRRADESAWLAWVVMATALSLWWPAFLALSRLAVRRLKLPIMLAAPIVWVALEYARAHLLTGFPWYYLSHSQHHYLPLIQIADFAGAWGVSFLVALVNAWSVDVLALPLRRRSFGGVRYARPQVLRFALVASLLLATSGYGYFRLGTARFREGPRVAVIQTDLEQAYKMGREPQELLPLYETLVVKAARQSPRPDLIIWPETAFPFGIVSIDPALDESALSEQARRKHPDSKADDWRSIREQSDRYLHGLADGTGVAQLVGSGEDAFEPRGPSRYNASILYEPRKPAIQVYRKQHLVPFGEFVPLRDTLPWLVALTPYEPDRVPSLDAGTSATPLPWKDFRVATAICFEDTVPHVVRRSFSGNGPQPDFLVNQSNDGWFQGSSEHDMHLAISVFRAVENRVPIARSANRGISAFVDGNGRILGQIPKLREDVLSCAIPLDDRRSLYSRWGDWLGLSCLAVTIGLVPQALLRSFRRQPGTTNLPSLPRATE